ncbi:MAG: S1C family serine protease, partial [Acidimicrobiales bacterium]
AAGVVGGVIGSDLTGPGTTTTATPARLAASTSVSPPVNVPAILSKVEPAIVDVTTQGSSPSGFFSTSGAGTGMILTSGGQVLTNAHVVAGASTVQVTLNGQSQSHPATVIASNPTADVALLQIHGVSGLPTVQLGNSSALKVGDTVIAIGNALGLGGQPTVTEGIVSALHRSLNANGESLSGLIQTDAAINPGNSGGPLVDAAGQVVGMNTAVLTGNGGSPAQNLGFAIPVNQVKTVVGQLRSQAKSSGGTSSTSTNSGKSSTTPATSGAFLGVGVETMNPTLAGQLGTAVTKGALVVRVQQGSAAATAGLKPGDIIVSLGGKTVSSANQLQTDILSHHPGDHVKVTWVQVQGQGRHSAQVTLGSRPTSPA